MSKKRKAERKDMAKTGVPENWLWPGTYYVCQNMVQDVLDALDPDDPHDASLLLYELTSALAPPDVTAVQTGPLRIEKNEGPMFTELYVPLAMVHALLIKHGIAR